MLSRFSDVLQTAADVLAPPPTRLEDFEYHWKMILNFYQNYDQNSKIHIEDTRIPHHLHQMLQLIVDEEKEQQGGTVGPCLEAIVQRSVCLLDALTALAAADCPPGARAVALTTGTALLRRTQQPCINSVHVYRPLQRLLIQCNEIPASPTEKEEVELLLTLCGLVRKEPGLANIFTTPFVEDKSTLLSIPEDIQKLIPIKSRKSTPKKNPLFEVDLPPDPLQRVSIIRTNSIGDGASCSSGDDNASCKSHKTIYEENDKFLLIDLLLSYLDSADNQVVLRACEGIMIVSSLPGGEVAGLVSGSPACEALVAALARRYARIPALPPQRVDLLNITWAYVAHDFGDKSCNKFHGYRELTSFFSWLDYCDTLMKECHPIIACHLSQTFRQSFLEGAAAAVAGVDATALHAALLAKCLKVIDSPELLNEFSNWLVGEGDMPEWPLLHTLISYCLSDDVDLSLETLKFFETIIEKGTEHSIHRLVLSRLSSRAYLSRPAAPEPPERDQLNDISITRERERNREAMQQLQHEDQVNEQITDILEHEGLRCDADDTENIHQIINSFLLLLPPGALSDPVAHYQHYIHDAHAQYQLWLDMTSSFPWRGEARAASSSAHSCDSRPEADLHLDGNFTEDHSDPVVDNLDKIDNTDSRITSTENLYRPPEKNCKREGCAHVTNRRTVNRFNSFDKIIDFNNDFSDKLGHRIEDLSSNADKEFDEGPFFRMLFKLLANMPNQNYQVNLHVTAIISKLALMPHQYLHEYLLNPMLPTDKKTPTLFKTLQELAKKLVVEIPRIKNYKKVVQQTRLLLMSEDSSYEDRTDHNPLVESLIVLEEFCKELAAIAFVKYQHSIQTLRHS